jgi:hypothetical protein
VLIAGGDGVDGRLAGSTVREDTAVVAADRCDRRDCAAGEDGDDQPDDQNRINSPSPRSTAARIAPARILPGVAGPLAAFGVPEASSGIE